MIGSIESREIEAMDQIVKRPANGPSAWRDAAVQPSCAGNPAAMARPWKRCRDGAAVLQPANDNVAGSGAAPELSCTGLLWLDLIDVEGHVLLAANFDGDLDAFSARRCADGAREAELAVNTIYLDELFDTSKYTQDMLVSFGTVIRRSLLARAVRGFPDRSFVSELFSAGDGARLGVRLCQDYG